MGSVVQILEPEFCLCHLLARQQSTGQFQSDTNRENNSADITGLLNVLNESLHVKHVSGISTWCIICTQKY